MKKFNNKYRIPSARLKDWDYGSPGLYFITICTKNRKHYFGNIRNSQDQDSLLDNASLEPSPIGTIANQCWIDIPKHFPFVKLDEFVLMPNHIHGILFVKDQTDELTNLEWKLNKFGPQSKNLGSIIRGFKTGVRKYPTTNKIEFEWQPRYYDHIIRTEKELNDICQYVICNPMNWEKDKSNVENLMM